MKKRIGSLLLAGLLCLSVIFSLAACKDNDKATNDTGASNTAKVTESASSGEDTTAPATTAPATDDGAVDVDLDATVDKFMDEAPCGTHNWVHMEYMASATLTEESLGEMVLEKMGISKTRYSVNFNKDEFAAFLESYQAEGDGSQAGDYITLTVTDNEKNETSKEIKPYFRIKKNLEGTAPMYTVCPDEQ